jgi:hypothetical protein
MSIPEITYEMFSNMYKEDELHKIYSFRIKIDLDIVNISNSENSFDLDTNLYEEYCAGTLFYHTDYICIWGYTAKSKFIDLHSKFEHTFDMSRYLEEDKINEFQCVKPKIVKIKNNKKNLILELVYQKYNGEREDYWPEKNWEEYTNEEDWEEYTKAFAFAIEDAIEIDQMIKQKLFAQKMTTLLLGRSRELKRLHPDN